MPRYARGKILQLINDHTPGNSALKGKALENAITYCFERVPGISITKRNILNISGSQEIDVAFWNDKKDNGFPFLPDIILIECKNWDAPVSSAAVQCFISKISERGRDFGILIAANGITGEPSELTQAHYQVAMALSKKVRLIVITTNELNRLISTEELIYLIKEKLTELVASGKVLYET